MKNILWYLMILSFPFIGSAQQKVKVNPYIQPEGFSTDGFTTYCLTGKSSAYLRYIDPGISITVPASMPYQKKIAYDTLLYSSLSSLLFEYKNYEGDANLSGYSIFALGNYCMMPNELLPTLNKLIFPNKSLLIRLYNWAKPFYKDIFSSLTVEEQETLIKKLLTAEQYVAYVLKGKNKTGYQKWLSSNKIKPDIKVTGFLARRVQKKQWNGDDCAYWVDVLKKDFLPLVKNKKIPASHYQVTDLLNTRLMIATDHIGRYFILDTKFKKKTLEPYVYIKRQEDSSIRAYRSCKYSDYVTYEITPDGECREKGQLKGETI